MTPTQKQKKQIKDARMVLSALRKELATAGPGPAAPAAGKTVTFTCTHAGCVTGITCAGVDVAFVGIGAATLPLGQHTLFYRVAGPANAQVTITATGAKMPTISDTTDGNGRAGGARPIVVK